MRFFNSKKTRLYFFFIPLLVILTSGLAFAGGRTGISAKAGAGLFVAADKDYYFGISTDLYPELGFQLDVSLIRLGLKFGYIYRKEEIYWGWYEHWKYTLSYLPAQFEFLIAPLDIILKRPIFSPHIGLMAGAFIATGDNDKSLPAFSIELGSELHIVDPFLLYGDFRYTYAPNNDVNAGGLMIVAGMGVQLSFSK